MRFALCFGPSGHESRLLVGRMLAALPAASSEDARIYVFPGGALGVLARPGRPFELDSRIVAGESRVSIVAGDPISLGGTVREELERAHCSADPVASFTALDGAFVAVRVDALAGRVVIVTDFLGMSPAFAAAGPGALLVTTTPTALLVDSAISSSPDPAGWGAMLGLGNLLGNRTKLSSVRRLPAASVLEFDMRGAQLSERRYWNWPHDAGRSAPSLDEILQALDRNVAAYRREYEADTVFFSGGFDSRLIAGLLQRHGDTPHAVIQRHPDENANADGRFAVLAAKSMGLPYEEHGISRDFFSSHDYLAYARASDLDVPSLYLFISAVARHLTPARGAVWLDVVLGMLIKRNAVASDTADYARRIMKADGLESRLNALGVFSPDWRAEMGIAARAALNEQMAVVPDTGMGARELRINTRIRLRIGTHFHRVYAACVPVATPGLDRESWLVASGHTLDVPTARAHHARLFRDHFPEAARVPFASGVKLSRVSAAAAPQLWLQQALAATQALSRRRPLRKLTAALGLRPFVWERSVFLKDLESRVSANDPVVDADAVHGDRSAEADAALFYWCEHQDLVARARRVAPLQAQEVVLPHVQGAAGA